MTDRLLVDVDAGRRVTVGVQCEDELPNIAGEPFDLTWPLSPLRVPPVDDEMTGTVLSACSPTPLASSAARANSPKQPLLKSAQAALDCEAPPAAFGEGA